VNAEFLMEIGSSALCRGFFFTNLSTRQIGQLNSANYKKLSYWSAKLAYKEYICAIVQDGE